MDLLQVATLSCMDSMVSLKPNGWFYKGVVGQNPPSDTEVSTKKEGLVHTYGNAATPFMYSARKVAEETFNKLIKELK